LSLPGKASAWGRTRTNCFWKWPAAGDRAHLAAVREAGEIDEIVLVIREGMQKTFENLPRNIN